MKNFLRISDKAFTMPILLALHTKPELWDQNILRTSHPDSPHRDCSDVWLMFNEVQEDQAAAGVGSYAEARIVRKVTP